MYRTFSVWTYCSVVFAMVINLMVAVTALVGSLQVSSNVHLNNLLEGAMFAVVYLIAVVVGDRIYNLIVSRIDNGVLAPILDPEDASSGRFARMASRFREFDIDGGKRVWPVYWAIIVSAAVMGVAVSLIAAERIGLGLLIEYSGIAIGCIVSYLSCRVHSS